MQTIDQLFLQNEKTGIDWQIYLNNQPSFMPIFFFLLDAIYLSLPLENYPRVSISADHWQQFIFKSLRDLIMPKAVRILVLELNTLRMQNILKGNTPEERFQYFVNLLAQKNILQELLAKYPLLHQELNNTIAQFHETTHELFHRLNADLNEIKNTLLNSNSACELINITRLSEAHRNGRAVTLLEFSANATLHKIIYKPRSLGIDKAYNKFLNWCNAKNHFDLYTPNTIYKNAYGWVEFIDYKSCSNLNEVKHYYKKLGNLLGIIYLLCGYDIHYENIIAHGEHPVIVDVECLFSPLYNFIPKKDELNHRMLVLDSFLLPRREMIDKKYSGFEISAFGGKGGEKAPQRILKPKNLGKDTMTVERAEVFLDEQKNIPVMNGEPVDPIHYQEEFISGFTEMYEFFLANNDYLLSAQSPLNEFKDQEIRVVVRNTAEYGKLLFESYHPSLLQNSGKRAAHFLWLKPDHAQDARHHLLESELRDLFASNIPIYASKTTSTILYDSAEKSLDFPIEQNGFDRVKEHIEDHLNQNDLSIQLNCIAQSLGAYALNNAAEMQNKSAPKTNPKQTGLQTNLNHLARAQLDLLLKYCIHAKDRIFWTQVEFLEDKVWRPQVIGIDLYNGLSGILLCFAYAHHILQISEYEHVAKMALKTLRKIIYSKTDQDKVLLGAYSGISGIIYTFHQLYHLWHDESLLEDIVYLTNLCQDLLNDEMEFDIIAGASGYLAILNHCKTSIPETTYKNQSATCLQYILKQHAQPHALPTNLDFSHFTTQPLLGFAHGAAGMIWAMQHYQKDADAAVKSWIENALNYERKHFSLDKNNWADFRSIVPDHKRYDHFAWCHGAVGIGLARFDMHQNGWNDLHIKSEIDQAILATQQNFDLKNNLCHGHLGHLEFLFTAFKKQWIDKNDYYPYLEKALLHLQETPSHTYDAIAHTFQPGLMTGAAGVAYQLLRLQYPEILSNVLLLQAA